MAKGKMYLVALLLVAAAMPVLGSTISTQIREGVYKEEVEGDLDAAIKIYEGIITAHAENQRYAAQAMYRLGLCHLKKGQKDKAISQFQSILEKYPNQKSIVEKTKKQLSKLKPAAKVPSFFDNQTFIFKIVPVISELHFQIRAEAKEKGLHYNNHIYGVDENFTRYNGGFITVENETSAPWTKDVHIMNASGGSTHFYDEQGMQIKVNINKRGFKSAPKYQYTWDPKIPIQPGQSRTLVWGFGINKMPQVADNRYTMQMSNHYGDKALECFLLIMPSKLQIYKGSPDYTLKKTVAGHDIYVYKREVPVNTTNRVNLTVGIGDKEAAKGNCPTVIKSVPETYANDVSPDLDKLSVTFDQTMKDGCWSWVQWNYEIPKLTDKAYYDSTKTTCYRPSKLKPATAYLIRINAKPYDSFMNADGIKARPFVLVFATKDKDGKPTPIPEEMLKFAKYINESSEVSSAKTNSKVSIFEKIDSQVTRFIGEQFGTIALEAGKQHLPVNSHIYYVDNNGTLYSGGMNSFYNWTGRTIKEKTSFGRTSNPNQTHYGVDGQKLNVEIVPHETMPNKWQIYWTPDQPLAPGESLYYGWSMDNSRKLSEQSNGTYKLKMQNHPGTSIVETFFLVLPKDLNISQSNKPTQSTELLNYNVFWWTKTVKQGENHIEEVTIAKGDTTAKTLKLIDAPWVDNEKMVLELKTPAGMSIGNISYTAKAQKRDSKDFWLIESYMTIPIQRMQQYTRVDAEVGSYRPVYGRTKNWLGDFIADYSDGKVILKTNTGGRKLEKEFDVTSQVYDNEEVLFMIRSMPLSIGFEQSFDIFPVQSASVTKCTINVTGKEKIEVKAGKYECYKVTLACYSGPIKALEHTLWFSADKHQYLVKYDAGTAVMELSEVGLIGKGPQTVRDAEYGYSFDLPEGWTDTEISSSEQYKVSQQLISPQMSSFSVLSANENLDSKETVRSAAKEDMELLKGVFKDYTLRKDSWVDRRINKLDASTFIADYEDKGKPMVEYRTYIKTPAMVYWFVFRVEKDKFDEFKPQYDSIINSFKVDASAVSSNKAKAEQLAAQGWKLWGQRKLAEAEEKFKEAIAKDAGCENAYQGLGWAQLNQGKKVNAKDSFAKCIKLNAENSAALNGLGWIAHGDGKTDEAVQWWEKAVKAAPGATASLNGLTQVYMERKDYEKAVKYYKMWLQVEPGNKDAKDGLDKAQNLLETK